MSYSTGKCLYYIYPIILFLLLFVFWIGLGGTNKQTHTHNQTPH